ncbi:MAG: bifunctional diaminohydroxyphosphoribosylaminopyrimidine deaminase/5-amino-6-(5-phosphoribosylamino)uracil reductase RibD [Chloroflexi bacterium]|nr:MAG: bifunctional diaminohydroxyphosphoribosylaminopyrimidine deaminase/5-amino-6-(5-phosphoribosylamino)uracil reductase RibD [Chloroflexota bacterium]
MSDLEFMQQALAYAHSVEGRTSPRPSVGAIVVRDGSIVGKGATSPPYGPHAEVHALNDAGAAAHGADLYVTLEPCCITVHTPPCTQAIIAAGIRRVIIGALDPNPRVYTCGIEQLRAAGIEVVSGVAQEEASAINRPFATYITQDRSYVTAKWAMTLDGKLATRTGDAYWISNTASRVWVHNLRDRVDAIMIGAGTARTDNPQLTVRLAEGQRQYERVARKDPLRIVLATQGQLPEHLHLLQDELATGTCIIVGETCPDKQRQRLLARGLEVLAVPVGRDGHIDLLAVLKMLASKGIMHVLLEGGHQLLGNALDRCLIDYVTAFIAPKLVGGTEAPSPIGGTGLHNMKHAYYLRNTQTHVFDGDFLVEGEVYYTGRYTSKGED